MDETISKRRNPKQDRSRETVDFIIQATALLLEEDGIEGLSTKKIAKRAGVSIGSVYQYFPKKEAILKQLVEFFMKKTMSELKEIIIDTPSHTPQEFAQQLVKRVFAYLMSRPKIREVFIRNFFSEVLPLVIPLEREIQEALRTKLETIEGIDHTRDLNLLAFTLIQTTLCLFRRAKVSQESFDFAKLEQEVQTMLSSLVMNPN